MKYHPKVENQTPQITEIYEKVFGYKESGFFVEFGVGQTIGFGSNTDFLADIGWEGLYYEPHPEYFKEALERHKDNNVKIFNFGVGEKYEETVLYPGDSCRKDVHETFLKLGWLPRDYLKNYGHHMVIIRPATESLQLAKCPPEYDLLSIDVEGYELPVVKNYNFDLFRPRLVVIELRDMDPKFPLDQRAESVECHNILLNNDYKIIFKDTLNAFYLDGRGRN